MTIWDTNVLIALRIAIEEQQQYEATQRYAVDSAMLAGWKAMRDALVRGEKVEISRSEDRRVSEQGK